MKDLFRLVFARLSQFDYETFSAEFFEHAPFRIIDAARSVHEPLADMDGFRDLYAYLEAMSPRHWNNPELYPHLFSLLYDGSAPSAAASMLALRAHLDLVPLSDEMFVHHRYFRRRATGSQTFERSAGGYREIPATIAMQPGTARFPLVYMPFPNLFDDVVGAETYCGDGEWPPDAAFVERHIAEAMEQIRTYCPVLFEGFSEAIGTIAVTAEQGKNIRHSYSAEVTYAGGIFVSIPDDNIPSLVEGLIHEYYHQRLWLWWLIEPPADLPPETLTIVSPVTNTERSALVMLHALLIYVSACDFYRDAVMRYEATAAWCAEHLAHLERGTRQLIAELERVLGDRPESLRFMRTVCELGM
jgi:hypothetical protein